MSCDKFFSLNHSGGQDENVSFVASFSADINDIEENVLKEVATNLQIADHFSYFNNNLREFSPVGFYILIICTLNYFNCDIKSFISSFCILHCTFILKHGHSHKPKDYCRQQKSPAGLTLLQLGTQYLVYLVLWAPAGSSLGDLN